MNALREAHEFVYASEAAPGACLPALGVGAALNKDALHEAESRIMPAAGEVE